MSSENKSQLIVDKDSSKYSVRIISVAQNNEEPEEVDVKEFIETLVDSDTKNVVSIFCNEKRQAVEAGMGGAITESAVSVINQLPQDMQKEIYDAYFSKDGCDYSIIRTHLGSCDFCLNEYSYDDVPLGETDEGLCRFSIAHDETSLIPAIKRALEYKNDLKVISSPWAPPAWMKVNKKRVGICGIGSLSFFKNSLNPAYYRAYAHYLAKYVAAYKAHGIDIWAITMQNETQNNAKWEGCTWSSDQSIDFISNHLGPVFEQGEIQANIFLWDWNKSNDIFHGEGFVGYNTKVLSNPQAEKYICGVAFHWYKGNIFNRLKWSEDFKYLDKIRNKFPSKLLLATEACQENGPWLGEWEPAARYIHDIINDFEHGATGWIDWNIVLDSEGGPNKNSNNCHAPIMVDIKGNGEIIKNPSYYVLKQFSRNIQPGSWSISTNSNVKGLDVTAFRNPGPCEEVAVFIGNNSNKEKTIKLKDGNKVLEYTIKPKSLTTFVYKIN